MTLEDFLYLGKKKSVPPLFEELSEGILDSIGYNDAPHEFDSRRILDNDSDSVFLNEELDSDNEGNDTDDLGISEHVDVPDWQEILGDRRAQWSFDKWVVESGLSKDGF